jgi:hypothetical protein
MKNSLGGGCVAKCCEKRPDFWSFLAPSTIIFANVQILIYHARGLVFFLNVNIPTPKPHKATRVGIVQPEFMAESLDKSAAPTSPPLARCPNALTIFRQHIAEQCALLNRIIQRPVRVWQRIEPALRHIAFHALAIAFAQQRHRIRLDVQRGMREWAFAREADQIPVEDSALLFL